VHIPDDVNLVLITYVGFNFKTNDLLLNINNSFVKWIQRMASACRSEQHDLNEYQSRTLMGLLRGAVEDRSKIKAFQDYIDAWRRLPGLPPDLVPPDFSSDMLTLRQNREQV
jgi:hypothetical protein